MVGGSGEPKKSEAAYPVKGMGDLETKEMTDRHKDRGMSRSRLVSKSANSGVG